VSFGTFSKPNTTTINTFAIGKKKNHSRAIWFAVDVDKLALIKLVAARRTLETLQQQQQEEEVGTFQIRK
jgi:hypothetical protein